LLASSFREVRILQNFLNTATLIFETLRFAELLGTAFSKPRLALRFKEVRILQSQIAPSTLSAKHF